MNTIQTYNLSVFISCVILCCLFAAAFTGHAFENPRFFRKRLRRLNFKKIRGCCFAQIVVLFFCRHIDKRSQHQSGTLSCLSAIKCVCMFSAHPEKQIAFSNGASQNALNRIHAAGIIFRNAN